MSELHIADEMQRLTVGAKRLTELKRIRKAQICPSGYRYVPEHCVRPPTAGKAVARRPRSTHDERVRQWAGEERQLADQIDARTDRWSVAAGPTASVMDNTKVASAQLASRMTAIVPLAARALLKKLRQGSPPQKKYVDAAIEEAAREKYGAVFARRANKPALRAAVLEVALLCMDGGQGP